MSIPDSLFDETKLHNVLGRLISGAFPAHPSLTVLAGRPATLDASAAGKWRMPWKTSHGVYVCLDGEPVCAMGFEMKSAFEVHQLQCLSEGELPAELEDWPERIVSVLVEFAEVAHFTGVRFCRGDFEGVCEKDACALARLPHGFG